MKGHSKSAPERGKNQAQDSSEEGSEEESSHTSCDSDSGSSVPEWDSVIDQRTGGLFYIECHPFVAANTDNKKPFSKTALRHSTRSKFLRLLRRKESKRLSKRISKSTKEECGSVLNSNDSEQIEEKQILLKVMDNNYFKANRKNSMIESVLGVSIGTFPDGVRLMVTGFLPDSPVKYEKNVKVGDWLKSINNIKVDSQNLSDVLDQIINKNEILIKIGSVVGAKSATKNGYQSPFVQHLTKVTCDVSHVEALCRHSVGILYLDTEKLSESGPEFDDVLYCFPRPLQRNVLCGIRGMFITINHLLADITKNQVKSSSAMIKGKLCHIIYTTYGKKICLFMLPDVIVNVTEAEFLKIEILRMLSFLYDVVENCFVNKLHQNEIDHFFLRFFTRILSGGVWRTTQQFLENPEPVSRLPQFEEILPAAQMINLPNEAQLQIDDALTELEACDYREWNEEPLDCQRLFTMLGSAWYHSGYLMASHLTYEDLQDVHSYCRQQGLLHLSRTEPVKSLVIWREVFPTSCRAKETLKYKIPEGKRYLLIVGSEKDLLTVIMEAGGCTEDAAPNTKPNPFYVEEAEVTLTHIQELGLLELADRFIATNPGPQVTVPLPNKKRLMDFGAGQSRDQFGTLKKETHSLLKRRSSDPSIVSYTSCYSVPDDDDESEGNSQGGYSEKSDNTDDVPSRLSVEKKTKFGSNEEGSDGEEFGESLDISEIRQTLLSETEDIQPVQITSGSENVLYHFVQFDKLEGVIISPPECQVQSQTREIILSNFRLCCQKIHNLFQNTLRFKDMSSQEMAKSVMNKSLIAIKEHGIMFECPFLDERESSKKNKIAFWVIGRLFYVPHAREFYVCYNDNIPQNLIEIAFKMNLDLPERH